MPPHSRDVKSLWQNNRRHAPHLSRHFLLKILVSSIRLHSRNALYKAARLQTLIEDDTVTFRSPYSMFFSVRMGCCDVCGFGIFGMQGRCDCVTTSLCRNPDLPQKYQNSLSFMPPTISVSMKFIARMLMPLV